MARKARRRLLRQYVDLYHDPTRLFSHGPVEGGVSYVGPVETILYPNGEPVIWFKTPDGLGLRLTVSNGPAGLGIHLDAFTGTPELTIASPNSRHLELCQYRQDDRSQAYRRWYQRNASPADLVLLGPDYGPKPETE